MPSLSQLLDVQDLDLASDRLSLRRETLPERKALEQALARTEPLDATHAALLERRESLKRSEHELGDEVAAMATKAKEVEDTLYSGTVKIPKELRTLQEEIRLLRERQSELELREMELLEEIDGVENEMADNRAAHEQTLSEASGLEAAVQKAEREIDAELAMLGEQRGGLLDGLPSTILDEYEKLRARERLAGRAAASIAGGSCGGCRMKLPVMEYSRIKAEPEDALLHCVHCGRLLVR